MSSPEVERFEVTEDDLANEFYPRMGRRQTKNQAIYGMWADNDSDDERPGFGKSNRRNKDMTAPIGFVSGGFKEGDKITKNERDADNTDSDSGEEVPIPKQRKQKSGPYPGFGHKDQTKEFGGWEKYTRGIGQKLLHKMGYEQGKGLGKTHQGITTPVEAKLRKGRAAVGAYGTERTERSLRDFPVYDSEEEEEKQFKNELHQWKKKSEGQVAKKKPKYVYKTAQELIETGGKSKKSLPNRSSKVKVIDMTGKEQKVMTGYHSISQRHDRPEEDEDITMPEPSRKKAFAMPELIHNLNILVDMAEEEIIVNDRKLRYESDHIINMKHEKERVDTVCEQEEIQLQKLQKVMEIVETCEERTKPGCENPLTLPECAKIFKCLQDDFYEEYKMYDLASLSVALVFPMVKDFFKDWDPWKDPSHGVTTIKEWQYVLEDYNNKYNTSLHNMNIFQRLLWDIWLPFVRTAILKWNPRNYDPPIELLETWKPVVPSWMMENIIDQLVLPRILQEVENWNPLTDPVPLHSWLHPWLPLMGDKLEPCYPPIRHKLANALTNWHPSDSSAKVILQPWLKVFKPGHTEAFLVKHILPKLGMCMQELVINPHQQMLESWHWVMSWSDVLPIKHMVAMLERTFFPKWLQVLCTWMSNMPNYEEITKWYLGWKSLFSEEYRNYPPITEHFKKALELMNRAVSGHFQPGVKENIAYFTHTERRQMLDTPPTKPPLPPPPPPSLIKTEPDFTTARSASPSSSFASNFKGLVEKMAQENNILFMPLPGKTQEAKQVYKFGKFQVYVDRNVLFVFENEQWIPISIQKMVDKAIGT
ncbi:tuftelin-interacting protein 11 [Mytilus galloprovincialis]|uniref:Tuftelin-interacting protein 11 n=1 Tax=Mytilus galloprovincialis TaxID=29158 RepID=A0A8B6DER4_MYTGA|nr:tuftelin-interacting protein 11 [Mytilus galloprovincialis]